MLSYESSDISQDFSAHKTCFAIQISPQKSNADSDELVYRQVRNFVIDITSMPATTGACIHWQVAQATSLQNIVFEMVQGGTNNNQEGIFMDNGSGGFYSDLVFNGGNYGSKLSFSSFLLAHFESALPFVDKETFIYEREW